MEGAKVSEEIVPQVFTSEEFGSIRAMRGEDGEPWFIAKDVCDALGLGNVGQALARLDEDEKSSITLNDGTPGNPNKAIVSEPGLYALILASRKPEAKAFKRWITHEVIPSIRRHGAYATPQTIESIIADPRNGIRLLQALADEQDRNRELEARNRDMEPKAFFADSVSQSSTSVLVGVLAKLLKQNGYDTGQNRLFKTLCADGFLIGTKGRNYHMPTQRAADMGLFEVKESTRTHSDGHTSIERTTLVTGKGQIYFINRYCREA